MSIRESIEIQCPKCGWKNETVIWRSVNRDINPEAKEELLAGRINLFHCADCGLKEYVSVALMYHDPENGFCVQFFPFGMVQDSSFFDQFTSDAHLDVVSDLPEEHVPEYFRNIHLVFSMDELVRYIYFRDRLAQRKAGIRGSSSLYCFGCDSGIKEGESCFSVCRLHQIKGNSGEDNDDVIDSFASLQVCSACMSRAAKEDIAFREKPLPLLQLEKDAIHQFARSLAGNAAEWKPVAEGRDACSLCGIAIDVGDSYRRIQLAQEVWNGDSVESKEDHTFAILCDSCSERYLILV